MRRATARPRARRSRAATGWVDFGEECDDANHFNGDACLDTCEIARCGDGHVYDGHEDCDDGNEVDDDACSNLCTLPVCGDGIVQAALGEECDDETEACNACIRDRVVFITSATTMGALGGLSGADYLCQQFADEAGIGGRRTYMAWLSAPGGSPKTRFFQSPGRYVRTDGEVLATSFDDLVDGTLLVLPNVDEHAVFTQSDVWTNTSEFGDRVSDVDHCEGWTSDSFDDGHKGRLGGPSALDKWSDFGDTPANPNFCDSDARLYCFEQ